MLLLLVACTQQPPRPPEPSLLHQKRLCREFKDPQLCLEVGLRLEKAGEFDRSILMLISPCKTGLGEACKRLGHLARIAPSAIDAAMGLGLACSANQREACEQIVLLHADRPDLVGDTSLKRAQALLAK